MPRPARVLVTGGVLLLVGSVGLLVLPFAPPGLLVVDNQTSFGWFAYADSGDGAAPAFVVVTSRELWAAAVAALGLALLAAGVGYARGARRVATTGDGTPAP